MQIRYFPQTHFAGKAQQPTTGGKSSTSETKKESTQIIKQDENDSDYDRNDSDYFEEEPTPEEQAQRRLDIAKAEIEANKKKKRRSWTFRPKG